MTLSISPHWKNPRSLLPSSYLLRKAERQHGAVPAKQKVRDEEEK